jgi:hypothetical protein
MPDNGRVSRVYIIALSEVSIPFLALADNGDYVQATYLLDSSLRRLTYPESGLPRKRRPGVGRAPVLHEP